jgi:hypothetical protein
MPRHRPAATEEPNEWGVTLDTNDEKIADYVAQWDWSDFDSNPVITALFRRAAVAVLEQIRETTMADIGSDGTLTFGLFEYEMPLRISLAELIDSFIKQRGAYRKNVFGLGAEEQLEARKLAGLLEGLASDLRAKSSTEEDAP